MERLKRRVTKTGGIVYTVAILLMLFGAGVRELAPDSAVGDFLSSAGGILLATFMWWLVFTALSVVFALLGHPLVAAAQDGLTRRSSGPLRGR